MGRRPESQALLVARRLHTQRGVNDDEAAMIPVPEKPHPDALRFDDWSDDPYSDLPCDSRRVAGGGPAGSAERPRILNAETLGVLCAEAQADGVPCFELGRDCAECEMALKLIE